MAEINTPTDGFYLPWLILAIWHWHHRHHDHHNFPASNLQESPNSSCSFQCSNNTAERKKEKKVSEDRERKTNDKQNIEKNQKRFMLAESLRIKLRFFANLL